MRKGGVFQLAADLGTGQAELCSGTGLKMRDCPWNGEKGEEKGFSGRFTIPCRGEQKQICFLVFATRNQDSSGGRKKKREREGTLSTLYSEASTKGEKGRASVYQKSGRGGEKRW